MNANITFFAASYGPRYSDAVATYVAIVRGDDDPSATIAKLDDVVERAAEYEREEQRYSCTEQRERFDNNRHEDGEDCDCADDIVTYGVYQHEASDLFRTVEELQEHRRALMNGEIVVLYN